MPTLPQLPDWCSILAEQILNSLIVAGITVLSTFLANQEIHLKVAGASFALTFLIEMRKYRKPL